MKEVCRFLLNPLPNEAGSNSETKEIAGGMILRGSTLSKCDSEREFKVRN